MIRKEKLKKFSLVKKFNFLFKIYKKIIKKKTNSSFITKAEKFNIVIAKIKKIIPKFFDKKSKIKILKLFSNKVKQKSLKKKFEKNTKILTKRFRNFISKFNSLKQHDNTKFNIGLKLKAMNRIIVRKKMHRNLNKRTFFYKILRKSRRRKIKLIRISRKKPIFTKKTKKEKKFLFKARELLIKTKKYLYRKKFPKIKGKKNKNFNFYYYNNIERAPFKFNFGRIVITYLINNTFINIHNTKKMLKVISAGKIGFKGPKRSIPFSRQVVARKAVYFINRNKLNVLDIFLNSNYNRWYYFLFKEISKPKIKPYVIRYLVISNARPHGFIRDKKHRRK